MVVVAAAAGTAAESPDLDTAPALIAARAQALLIGLLRLALGAAGVAAAVARGVEARVALELFALAAILLAFAVYARRGGVGARRLDEPERAVEPLRVEANARALALAAYPSTIGLTLLTAIAVWPSPELGAFLAGLLGGLGILAFVAAAEIARWERHYGGRLLAERRPKGRVFVQQLGRR